MYVGACADKEEDDEEEGLEVEEGRLISRVSYESRIKSEMNKLRS